MSNDGNRGHGFVTTPWSLVIAAGSLDEEAGRKALGELVRLYKPALTFYLRKKLCGDDEHLADDLFSAFVEKILVGKELVGKAHPRQGHQFRQFIMTALHRFAITELRRLQTLKRQPPEGIESLERLLEYDGAELAITGPADFDVAWARNVVAEALRRMEDDCLKSGRAEVWGVFEHRLRAPILDGVPPMPYAQLIQRFGFESPAQAYNVLGVAKRKFEQHLREVISGYVADWNSVDAELRELQVILAHATNASQ